MRYQMASDVLAIFRYYTAIRELIWWYNATNEAGVVPAQLQDDAINAIEAIVDKHSLRHSPPSPQLVSQVLESTSRPFTVTQTLEARDFHILCSGENLRFETIGYLLATAGRSLTFGFAPDMFNDPANRGLKSQLVDELLRASTTCLFLCTMLATVNDISIWMFYENYLFTTMMCGYAGKLEPHARSFMSHLSQAPHLGDESASYPRRSTPLEFTKNLLLLVQPGQIHFNLPRTTNTNK
jgi:hypothetical protein